MIFVVVRIYYVATSRVILILVAMTKAPLIKIIGNLLLETTYNSLYFYYTCFVIHGLPTALNNL